MTPNDEMQLKNDTAKIKVSKNGPYIISGEIPIRRQVIIADSDGTATEWQSSTKYPRQKTCSLCRCGKSKNKPFCDGTHAKTGFEGTETAGDEAYLNQPKEIYGPMLKLEDVEDLCASARFCHRAGGIWKLVPKSDDPENKQTAIEETCDCPSGRLVISDKKTGITIEPNLP
jgi:CDGSH-type Zn-finger protein